MAADVRAGLTKPFKELSPRYFYDERGSELFEQITELPEYYPTRCEREILERRRRRDRAPPPGDPATLIELGSGSAAKTRVLLDAMRDAGCLDAYAPVDISEEITRETAEAIASEYGITVHGLVCDFERDLERMPLGGPRVIALLGRHDRQLRARAARELPGAGREPARRRRPLPARHGPRQGPRDASRPPTTTPRG